MLNIILIIFLFIIILYFNIKKEEKKEHFWNAAKRAAEAVANAARRAAEAAYNAAKREFEKFKGTLRRGFEVFKTQMQKTLSFWTNKLKEIGTRLFNIIKNLLKTFFDKVNIDPCNWIGTLINKTKLLVLVREIVNFFQKKLPEIFNKYLLNTINRLKNELFIHINLFINNINRTSSHIILLINQIYQKTIFFAFNFFKEVMQDPFNFGFFLITLPITKLWLIARTFLPFIPNYSFPNLVALFLFAFAFINSFFIYFVFEYWYFTLAIVFFMIKIIISILNKLP